MKHWRPYTGRDPQYFDDCPEPTATHLERARLQLPFHATGAEVYELAQEYAWQDAIAQRRRDEDDAALANYEVD